MAAPDGAGPAMEMLVPPKRLSLEASRDTELNAAAWAIFDAVRAAAQRTALPPNWQPI
jgi:hypothetical protein